MVKHTISAKAFISFIGKTVVHGIRFKVIFVSLQTWFDCLISSANLWTIIQKEKEEKFDYFSRYQKINELKFSGKYFPSIHIWNKKNKNKFFFIAENDIYKYSACWRRRRRKKNNSINNCKKPLKHLIIQFIIKIIAKLWTCLSPE